MGKYASGIADLKNLSGKVNVEIIKTRALQAIANELAEANRLTRIKRRYLLENLDGVEKEERDRLLKELEDQAL